MAHELLCENPLAGQASEGPTGLGDVENVGAAREASWQRVSIPASNQLTGAPVGCSHDAGER